MKIGVLFNCQNIGIGESLRQLLPSHEVVNYRFVDVSLSDQAAAEAASVLRGCQVVITTTTGAKLRDADPAALAAAGVRIVKIPHVVFGGYHPDSCYSPDPNRGIPGPTERFHSRVAACGFLAGLDIEDTRALYSRLPFARLGYFEQFAQQRAAMIEQWAGHGIDLAPWFDRWAAVGCFMHSMNHPKIGVLFDIARIICGKIDLPAAAHGVPPEDNMLIYASHPVLEELARFLGIAPETQFRAPGLVGRRTITLDLDGFLASSFSAFAAVPRAKVRDLGGVPDAMRALGLGGS